MKLFVLGQYTAGRPPLSQLPKPLIAIRSDRLVVSLISDQGYFTFLYGYTKYNIHNWEGGRKESKKKQVQEERSLRYFPSILLAIASMYSSESLTNSPGMLTHSLTLAKPASESTGSSSCFSRPSDFPQLLSTVFFCSLLCSASFYLLTLGPSFPRSVPVS